MRDNNSDNKQRVSTAISSKPALPDFDTLRDLARNDPAGLEQLRLALCNKVIDEAPLHAKPRLKGLMFQINARRQLSNTELEACEDISEMMNESLQRMQAMLKDLRTVQSESILLSTRKHRDSSESNGVRTTLATVLPFNRKNN